MARDHGARAGRAADAVRWGVFGACDATWLATRDHGPGSGRGSKAGRRRGFALSAGEVPMRNLTLNGERLWASPTGLARIGATAAGGGCRLPPRGVDGGAPPLLLRRAPEAC